MKREVLKSYFEKTCSPSETIMVEQWLVEPQNQERFEQFLESYWDEHTEEYWQQEQQVKPVAAKYGIVHRYMPRVAAVAAVLSVVAFSVYHFAKTSEVPESHPTIAAVSVEPEHAPVNVKGSTVVADALPKTVEVKKTKARQYGKKNPPENAVVQVPVVIPDTTTKPAASPRSFKAVALNKVRINDSLFSKLSRADQISVFNHMALSVNFDNATFRDIAVAFRDKYGIVMELCADAKPDKILKGYTASFSKITLSDLINDMSNQMMFSYSVSNNVVKVCFN